MTLTKKIAWNTIIHTAGKFSASLVGLVTIGLITRYLGTEGYGYYTTIFAYLFFFSTIGDLGLYLVAVNELGKTNDKRKLFSNIFTMRFVSGIILMGLASALIWLFPYPIEIKLGTLIISISVFLMMNDQILTALFQKEMKTKFVAMAEIIGKVVILGLVFAMIKKDAGFMAILFVSVFGFLIHFIFNLFFARKILPFKFEFDKQIWKNILEKSWPVATYMIFSMIYFKADTIILSLYHPQSVVGIYGAPYKILEVLIAFPAIFMGLVSPHLSEAWEKKDKISFSRKFNKAYDFLSVVIWPLIIGTVVLAKPIMLLIAGKQFVASIPVLQILIVATGIIFWAHLTTFGVVAIGKQKQMMKYYIFSSILALALYFIFIPTYGVYAAGSITVLIELLIFIASWKMVTKSTGIKINFDVNIKSLLSAIIMGCVLLLTKLNLFVLIGLGIVVYFTLIYLFGIINKDAIKEFKK
jgi:O-antigen/teichoic acid export membrane protein